MGIWSTRKEGRKEKQERKGMMEEEGWGDVGQRIQNLSWEEQVQEIYYTS
jgi:hypothetical protein